MVTFNGRREVVSQKIASDCFPARGPGGGALRCRGGGPAGLLAGSLGQSYPSGYSDPLLPSAAYDLGDIPWGYPGDKSDVLSREELMQEVGYHPPAPEPPQDAPDPVLAQPLPPGTTAVPQADLSDLGDGSGLPDVEEAVPLTPEEIEFLSRAGKASGTLESEEPIGSLDDYTESLTSVSWWVSTYKRNFVTQFQAAASTIRGIGTAVGDFVGTHATRAWLDPEEELNVIGQGVTTTAQAVGQIMVTVATDPVGTMASVGTSMVNTLDEITSDPEASGRLLGEGAVTWATLPLGGPLMKGAQQTGRFLRSTSALGKITDKLEDTLGAASKHGTAGKAAKGGFGVNGQIGSLPTGADSSILRGLYLDQVGSKTFGVKLGIHNAIKKVTTLGRGKWVTQSDIRNILEESTSFRIGASTVHRIGDSFIIGGRESLGYFNRATSHHEMLHIGQYIRKPNLIDTRPIGYYHEIIPSFLGTPELYGGGTILIVGGTYLWVNSGGE